MSQARSYDRTVAVSSLGSCDNCGGLKIWAASGGCIHCTGAPIKSFQPKSDHALRGELALAQEEFNKRIILPYGHKKDESTIMTGVRYEDEKRVYQ